MSTSDPVRLRGPHTEGPAGHYLLLLQIRQVHLVEDEQVRLKPKGLLKQRVSA